MENGAQPAAGGHCLAAAPPNFRERVVDKIMKNLPQVLQGQQFDDLHLHRCASQYEDRVFSQSDNLEAYLRTISIKMMRLQHKRQQPVQAAPDHQQQEHMGNQMQPLNAVLARSSAAAMPQTASTIHLAARPPQVQNVQIKVNQAQPSFATPVAPPQWYHAPRNTTSSTQVAPVVQQSAGEVDSREEIFQKITSLKDAHLSELVEFERALRARVPHIQSNEQLMSLPKEQADYYKKAVSIMGRIRCVLSFLQVQKSNMPKLTKDQFDKCQTALYSLLQFYRENKAREARKDAELQPQNCNELPRAVNITSATDKSQQKHEEQPAAEAFPQSSQSALAGSPLAQQQNHSDHLAGEAENVEVSREDEAPEAVNLTTVNGDTESFTGGTCSQQIQQANPTDEAIPQLTLNVDRTSPAEFEAEDDAVQAEAETETSLSPAAVGSIASDMGVNLKRAFSQTNSGTMDASSCVQFDDKSSAESCYKRRKTDDGSLLDEIGAVCRMLIETEVSISKDDTGEAGGTVIELYYNTAFLAPDITAVIGASEIATNLLVPADYPLSSPVIQVKGGPRTGLLGSVDVAFRHALGLLPEPRSIEGIARAWDSVARRTVGKFAHELRSYDSRYDYWVSCMQTVVACQSERERLAHGIRTWGIKARGTSQQETRMKR